MILITGNDSIVDALCSALDSLGRPYRRVDKLDAGHAWELHATTVMLVESLPRVGATASASERGLREIISAANAPGVRSAIIVTPRPDADADLRAVRRWRARVHRWFGARTLDSSTGSPAPAPT